MVLKLGIASKGRMGQATRDWLAAIGIAGPARDGDVRNYASTQDQKSGIVLELHSAIDLVAHLAAGRLHLAVTGTDLVREHLPLWHQQVVPLALLGFARADLVLAVPCAWSDCVTLDDFDDVASRFRKEHGFRLRIATKYHRLVREFLREAEVANYQLVNSRGATEGAVGNLYAEAIADITSTGGTMSANHLKPLEDGLILRSEATLWQSRSAEIAANDQAVIACIKRRLGDAIPLPHDP